MTHDRDAECPTVRSAAETSCVTACGTIPSGVGQASAVAVRRSRKVRAPQGRALGNAQAGRPDGTVAQKHTARLRQGCSGQARGGFGEGGQG
jgi:hypothetical protein